MLIKETPAHPGDFLGETMVNEILETSVRLFSPDLLS